jgi:hypothetical protein
MRRRLATARNRNSQKAGFGLSPPRSTPKIAVASGSSPMKTIECAEVMLCSARAVRSGNPTTTPSATMASAPRSLLAGGFWRRAQSSAAPSSAAITARADVRNNGSKPPTAMRVAGRDPLKMITPRRPLPHPSADRCIAIFPSTPAVLYTIQAGCDSHSPVQFGQTVWRKPTAQFEA